MLKLLKKRPYEIMFFIGVIVVLGALRCLAMFRTGIEIDEPIYRYAAAYAMKFGFPSVRPEVGHNAIPFLYHHHFFCYFLHNGFISGMLLTF